MNWAMEKLLYAITMDIMQIKIRLTTTATYSRLFLLNSYLISANTIFNLDIWFEVDFYGPVNTMKVMSSQSVYLTTLLLGRISPLSD